MECIDSSMAVWQRRAECYTVGKVWSAKFYTCTLHISRNRRKAIQTNSFGTYIGVIRELGNKNEAGEGVYGVWSQIRESRVCGTEDRR